MHVSYSARSHAGLVRENNEDNLCINTVVMQPDALVRPFAIDGSAPEPTVLAVCDGVGGEENGELASFLAAQNLSYIYSRIQSSTPAPLDETVWSYVKITNEAIYGEAQKIGKRMGTTLALAIVARSGIHCFNIGDSRIYCLDDSTFRQVTNDHSLAAEKERNAAHGVRAPIEEKDHHKITRCLGIGNKTEAESYPPIKIGSRILICTDGLSDMVHPGYLEKILRSSERASEAADALINLALENGGNDNVTAIVADIKYVKTATGNKITGFLRNIGNR